MVFPSGIFTQVLQSEIQRRFLGRWDAGVDMISPGVRTLRAGTWALMSLIPAQHFTERSLRCVINLCNASKASKTIMLHIYRGMLSIWESLAIPDTFLLQLWIQGSIPWPWLVLLCSIHLGWFSHTVFNRDKEFLCKKSTEMHLVSAGTIAAMTAACRIFLHLLCSQNSSPEDRRAVTGHSLCL